MKVPGLLCLHFIDVNKMTYTEILIISFADSRKSITFAMESSRGIRAEGMTTLSRKLDASPKSRCLSGFYYFSFAEIQY